MNKYRSLTSEELKTFEKEFVEYLVVNGIVAEEWERLKKEEPESTMKIIDLFSDVILAGVLRKINFLEVYTKGYYQAIQCLEDKMITIAVSSMDKSIDFSNFTFTPDVLDLLVVHKGEKKYEQERELEVFELTEKGYILSDGQLFKSLFLATVSE